MHTKLHSIDTRRSSVATSGGMCDSVPTVLVVLCVACCLITRDSPRSASFATAPYGAVLQLLTSTLRAFTAGRYKHRMSAATFNLHTAHVLVLPCLEGQHLALIMTVLDQQQLTRSSSRNTSLLPRPSIPLPPPQQHEVNKPSLAKPLTIPVHHRLAVQCGNASCCVLQQYQQCHHLLVI